MAYWILVAGDNLQTKADAAAEGDLLILTPGTYSAQKVLPKDGQTWIGQSAGVILDGNATQDYAFIYDDMVSQPRGVTLKNMIIRNYTGGTARGAIYGANTQQWTLDNLRITGITNGRGIDLGQSMIIRSCIIGDCAYSGIGGFQASNVTLENCELYNNNTLHIDPDSVGTDGGMKIATCVGTRIRNCYFHDNYGPGLWFDIDCHDIVVTNTITQRNSHRGIQIEISDTIKVINGLHIGDGASSRLPGSAGIFVSSSSNVEIGGCRFASCNRITQYDDPTRGTGAYGPRRITGLNLHDNTEVNVTGQA